MSTIETILNRMMNDSTFANAIFADVEDALAEYSLSAGEVEMFQQITRTDFEGFASASPEERKSLASRLSDGDLSIWQANYGRTA